MSTDLSPPDTSPIDDVISRLDTVVEWCLGQESRLGYFAAMYRRMTLGVKADIIAGNFEDGARMVRFDCLFAEHYFRAFEAHRAGEILPAPWRLSFEARHAEGPLVLQHLLLGMNAHINYDLGLTVAALVDVKGLAALLSDYNRINTIIGAQLDQVQDRLNRISPALSVLDRIAGRSDENLFAFSVEQARAGAWRFAEQLLVQDEAQRPHLIEQRAGAIFRLGRRIAQPGFPLSWGVRAAAYLEPKDVRHIIEVLRS